jgi:hypothetical protein
LSPRTRLAVFGVGLLLLNAWEWIFGAYLPTPQGTLGNDWAHKLPLLLDGSWWFLKNGFFPLPWFTPSFCGGIPLFPHPASFYVSLPQLLSFFMDPLRAAHTALLVFAGAGLFGTYALLRHVYRAGPWPALLGAGVFLFNGFYAHRMLVGHLEFHGFMLLPGIAALLLRGGPGAPARVLGAGAALAYLFLSGATQLFFPIGISLLALWLLAGVVLPDFRLRDFPLRLAAAGGIALALGAGKLAGSLAILSQLPRDFYPLPGIDGLWRTVGAALTMLARGGGALDPGVVVNAEFALLRNELEYGVTPVPFLLLGIAAVLAVRALARGARPAARQWLCALALALLLALPVLLNVRSVGAAIEALPVFRNLSNLLRWLSAWIAPLAAASGLVVDRVPALRRNAALTALAALALVVALNAGADRTFYRDQLYPPGPVVSASDRTRAAGAPIPIRGIEATLVGGEIQLSLNRNDVLVRGMSQLACYEPLFGFRLEHFPRGNLHPGPVLEARGGELNLKNPACYVYPEENGCRPGDPFRTDQLEQARRFTHFEPYDWQRPWTQQLADAVSLAALLGCTLSALLLAGAAWHRRRRSH